MSINECPTTSYERVIGHYDWEDGAYVKICASNTIDTKFAWEMATALVERSNKGLPHSIPRASKMNMPKNYLVWGARGPIVCFVFFRGDFVMVYDKPNYSIVDGHGELIWWSTIVIPRPTTVVTRDTPI